MRNLLNTPVLGASTADIFFQMIILSMYLYTSDKYHAWFYFGLPGAHRKQKKMQNEKFLFTVGLEPSINKGHFNNTAYI